ncbi:MAG TPA: methyltransferase domain-containing protein [Gaiellaceae bacterium]|nr:methyltransferase domain-containing protein [Gaiellaceae bacterium]
MSQVWSERASLYRDSEAHRAGEDLDLIVEWASEDPGRRALDVATGGGHVARRLREAGFDVVSCDPAAGMEADVIASAEALPFEDGAFDVVACRVAAHHFEDVERAVVEMARVSSSLVIVADNLNLGEAVEEAERLRDETHVRCYSEAEWRTLLTSAGVEVADVRVFEKRIEFEPWLARAGCEGERARRIRELLGDRIEEGRVLLSRAVFKGRKA